MFQKISLWEIFQIESLGFSLLKIFDFYLFIFNFRFSHNESKIKFSLHKSNLKIKLKIQFTFSKYSNCLSGFFSPTKNSNANSSSKPLTISNNFSLIFHFFSSEQPFVIIGTSPTLIIFLSLIKFSKSFSSNKFPIRSIPAAKLSKFYLKCKKRKFTLLPESRLPFPQMFLKDNWPKNHIYPHLSKYFEIWWLKVGHLALFQSRYGNSNQVLSPDIYSQRLGSSDLIMHSLYFRNDSSFLCLKNWIFLDFFRQDQCRFFLWNPIFVEDFSFQVSNDSTRKGFQNFL